MPVNFSGARNGASFHFAGTDRTMLLSATLFVAALACAPGAVSDAVGPATPAPVATIAVVLASTSVVAGSATQATATILDSTNHVLTGYSVEWSSANPAVVTVGSDGAVRAVASGSSSVIATSNGKHGGATIVVTTPATVASGRWVTGYYVGYQRDLYPEQTIDFTNLTHITVGRIRPTVTGGLITDFDIDAINGPAMARTISARAHQANRKALLMLGGAGEHDGFVGAASSANRAAFVQKLLWVMSDLGYDGLDVDWEPIDAVDQAPLLALLTDLRSARPGIILTIPVGWVNTNFPAIDPWYVRVASVVDQMNIMTYEMAGNWGGWTSWYSAALFDAQPTHPSSIAASAAAYKSAGIATSKLGIGVPFYGTCWRNVIAPRLTLGSGADVYASDNDMSYTNIMSLYYVAAARSWDPVAQVPYLSYLTAKGPNNCNFISYDDPQSVAAKGNFVKANGYGGAIIWTLAQGHLPTAAAGQQDPLLTALYGAIAP